MTHSIANATAKLARATSRMRFSAPVAHVYYPLNYASQVVAQFEDRFGRGPKELLRFGMNPGPFGMGQTGIPFGEVSFVRDWMQITGNVSACSSATACISHALRSQVRPVRPPIVAGNPSPKPPWRKPDCRAFSKSALSRFGARNRPTARIVS